MDEKKEIEEKRFDDWSDWAGLIALIAVAAIFGGRGDDTKTNKNQIENEGESPMENITKLDDVKDKLINRIKKELDKETLTSKEIFDYAETISSLKRSDEYSKLISGGFGAGVAAFNGPACHTTSEIETDKKDDKIN